MANPHARMVFSRIETRAVLPDGRVITAWHSYPRGVGKAEYDRIDAAMVRAFGEIGTRTVGTPMTAPDR